MLAMSNDLFKDHVEQKTRQFREIIETAGWEHLLISSGSELIQFRDDLAYPFKVNPYFKEFVPLVDRPDSFLLISEDAVKPTLLLKDTKDDYWHTPTAPLPDEWHELFDVQSFTDTKQLFGCLPKDTRRLAYLGPKMSAMSCIADEVRNLPSLLNRIDWLRGSKSAYEHACLREANRIAVRGHRAAEQAFRAGKSEVGILNDYLQAADCQQDELAYSAIVGLNQNAAVLHHAHLSRQAPQQHHSLLIDAGNQYCGYASDITRTYAADSASPFAELINRLDQAQQQLVAEVRPGKSFVDLHVSAHSRIAAVLAESGIVSCDAESALEQGITRTFFPHGLGHFIGVQVHDKGGNLASPEGDQKLPPADYPHLRNTRDLEVGQVLTVEPGLYFIPQLLESLRDSDAASSVNWSLVEQVLPYGGIRIEDSVLVTEGDPENFTRNAFAE